LARFLTLALAVNMSAPILTAVLPVFAIILLGYGFRRHDFPVAGFWDGAERLTYFLLLPLLLFQSIATADIRAAHDLGLVALVVVAGYGLQALLTFAVWGLLPGTDGKGFGSLFQGAMRFNNYIGISVVLGLYGREGVALYAAVIALGIPLSNIFSIAVMAHWSDDRPLDWGRVGRTLALNPLILATLAGILVQLAGLPLGLAGQLVTILAGASLPLGLLCVGAALELRGLSAQGRALGAALVLKLAAFPALLGLAGHAMGLSHEAQGVVMIFGALPCAASCTVLARQMGANVPLMAAITALTTLLALITIPVVLLLIPS
jgi:malonate transporter and related proteins